MAQLFEWIKATPDNVPQYEKLIIRNSAAVKDRNVREMFPETLKIWLEEWPDITIEYLAEVSLPIPDDVVEKMVELLEEYKILLENQCLNIRGHGYVCDDLWLKTRDILKQYQITT